MAAPVYYTAEMVRSLPDDGRRYETIRGELVVTPAPALRHQVLVARLFSALDRHLERHPIGTVLTSPADLSWGPDLLVQPDLFVADRAEVATGEWTNVKTLLLVIEILSASTARHDRFTKRRLYQEVPVPVYWIVDPETRLVEVWTPQATLPVVETERISWQPEPPATPLTIELAELFGAE